MSGRRPAAGRGLRFLVTGIVVNAALYAALWLALAAGAPYPPAIAATYAGGVVWSYLQNRLWSWRDDAPAARSLPRFLMVHVAVCLVHLGFTALLVEAGGVAPAWAALISAATLTAPVFLLLDRLVFTAAR